MKNIPHWINGVPTEDSPRDAGSTPSARLGEIFNPAAGEVAGQVHLASTAEVDAAVAAAVAAWPAWRDTSLTRRAGVLFRFRELMYAHRDELA
uniref:aldehyde dehydrogenase family protein n=1 Tax=Streptosporangium amethystogenes TaxID=2002 RepID=UPI0004C902D2